MQIHKAYRLKLYPNVSQERHLIEITNSVRFVWNYYLALKEDCYALGGKPPTGNQCSADLTVLRKQEGMEWLRAVISRPQREALRDLDLAYKAFFEKNSSLPKFKSKKDEQLSFRLTEDWRIKKKAIQIDRNTLLHSLPWTNILNFSAVRKYGQMVDA